MLKKMIKIFVCSLPLYSGLALADDPTQCLTDLAKSIGWNPRQEALFFQGSCPIANSGDAPPIFATIGINGITNPTSTLGYDCQNMDGRSGYTLCHFLTNDGVTLSCSETSSSFILKLVSDIGTGAITIPKGVTSHFSAQIAVSGSNGCTSCSPQSCQSSDWSME